MTTGELVARLRELGVRLRLEAGELRVQAPKGALTDALRAALRARRDELVALLERGAAPDDLPPLERAPRTDADPPSFGQRRLWFLQRLEPELAAYNIPLNWNLRGALDVRALGRALTHVVARHEALRTVFPATDGVPRQHVLEPWEVRLAPVGDEEGREHAAWRREVLRRITADAETAFDLARGPLLRPALYRLGPDEHVLCVCVHHAVFDGVSIGVLLDELIAGYEACLAGREPLLAPLPVQYADYARWQERAFAGEAFRRELDWWKRTLAGELPVLALPADRPRPAVQTYRGDREELPLPAALVRDLVALGQAQGATLYMVMLAGYLALLQRLTGQTDLLVGTAINGRDRPELERLIGFFVNTLVIRTDVSGDPDFRALVARVREACLGAFEHRHVPFERLVDELQPARTLSTAPVFQTLFLNELEPDPPRAMGGLVVRPHGKDETLALHVARNDLCLWVSADEDGLIAWAEYNTDLFDAARIRRLLAQYVRLLEAAAADPDARLSRLALLAPDERRRLLVDWSRRGEPFDARAVHRAFEDQAARAPERTAIVFPALDDPARDERVSYGALERRANRLAHHLAARGVRPGALVGLCLERSPALLVAQLAILKAGAAYVPLDPAWPAERLARTAHDARLAHAVVHGDLRGLLAGTALAPIDLEREADAIAARPDGPLGVAVGARERMYVLYTSGSTGAPKGVAVEHRSVANFLASMRRAPGLAAGETLLALTTPSFDISVLELFLPLTSGATVALAPRAATLDGALLAALVRRLAPDVLQATPATWQLLLHAGWEGAPATLRALCGGEALPRELAARLLPRAKELWNLYGPTETTVWSTAARVRPGEGPVRIGAPIANTRAYVLDAGLQPVPLGVTGELWIAGDGLARGYLGRPRLTAERFRPDPWSLGERMYRTGDLARWHERADGAGELECLGRIDHQVKLRGFRIELGEVESVLAAVPGVRACAAIVREDAPGDRRLAAYWARAPGSDVDEDALREAARRALPAYMVPSLFCALDALPLSSGGKVDRRALQALAPGAGPVAVQGAAPRDALEARVARAWAEALGVERVPVDRNVFDLGGHSLLLAQVHARLARDWPELSILALFQHPTVAALAAHLARAAEPGGAPRDARRAGLAAGREALLSRRSTRRAPAP